LLRNKRHTRERAERSSSNRRKPLTSSCAANCSDRPG
jgi:hypothetical protein